ncbi:MAG: hypothetical protein M1370_05755 [Bacteroidetes bacterium]|nr:hypothetical protein [Bacteroidota bacterium]
MLRPVHFANALTIVVVAIHLLGGLLAAISAATFLSLFGSWLLLNLSGFAASGTLVTWQSLITGAVTAGVLTWLSGVALALLYNALAGERKMRA